MVSSTSLPHFTLGKDSVPILQKAGWAPGPVWTGGKSRPHRDSIPDRSARSQSLHRLSYRAHKVRINYIYIRRLLAICAKLKQIFLGTLLCLRGLIGALCFVKSGFVRCMKKNILKPWCLNIQYLGFVQ